MRVSVTSRLNVRRQLLPLAVIFVGVGLIACGGKGVEDGGNGGSASASTATASTATASTATASTATASTATASTGSPTYVPFQFSTTMRPSTFSPSGSFVTNDTSKPPVVIGGATMPHYTYGAALSASNSQLKLLKYPVGNNYSTATSLNNLGNIAGSYGLATSVGGAYPSYQDTPAYWSSASASPVALALPTGETNRIYLSAISKSGAIYGHTLGIYGSGVSLGSNYVWASSTSKPVTLRPWMPSGSVLAGSFSDTGLLVVQGTDQGTLLYKPPYTAAPTVLTGADGKANPFLSMWPNGTITGSAGGRGYYILGTDYSKAVYMPGTSFISAINSLGQACGGSGAAGNFGEAYFWSSVTATPITLPSGVPGAQAIFATALFDKGVMVVADDYGNSYWIQPSTKTSVATGRRSARAGR